MKKKIHAFYFTFRRLNLMWTFLLFLPTRPFFKNSAWSLIFNCILWEKEKGMHKKWVILLLIERGRGLLIF